MKYTYVISSPIGKLEIVVGLNKLITLNFADDETELSAPIDCFGAKIIDQLTAYFADPHYLFDIDYDLQGTPFQNDVWQSLKKIPVGKTLTYGQLAKKIGTGPRAIGQACRTNPIPIIIPCHRIVAASNLGGFAGNIKGRFQGIKEWLLKHESKNMN